MTSEERKEAERLADEYIRALNQSRKREIFISGYAAGRDSFRGELKAEQDGSKKLADMVIFQTNKFEAERERSRKLIEALKLILLMPNKAMSVADLARRALMNDEASQT